MAAFRPALLTADSFLYMRAAVTGQLGVIRPNGYPLFLSLFTRWPHVLTIVIGLQHLMGIAIAVIVYGLLRHWGLPGWGATLAALPVLFDPREIALESYILPDTLFGLVIIVAVALLLTRSTPRPWQCVLAGLLFAYAAGPARERDPAGRWWPRRSCWPGASGGVRSPRRRSHSRSRWPGTRCSSTPSTASST